MKLKAVWLTAAGLTTLGLIMAGSSLRGVSQQMWNPHVARAAKVTVNLLKGNSMNPILLARSTRSPAKTMQPISVKFADSNDLIRYTLDQRDSFSYANIQIGQIPKSLVSLRKPTRNPASEPDSFEAADSMSDNQDSTFQNWDGSVEGTLKKQNYQIRKLELELAQEQYKDGKLSKAAFNQKALQYRLAAQEFKAFLDSSRMADQP